MSRDTTRTHLHLHSPHHADLLEDFTRHPLLPDEIYLAPDLQPTNPEDEEDIVPEQHAAFGIRAATGGKREGGWRDFGLGGLLEGFKEGEVGEGVRGGAVGSEGNAGTGVREATRTGNGQAGDVLRRRQVAREGGNISMGSNLRS